MKGQKEESLHFKLPSSFQHLKIVLNAAIAAAATNMNTNNTPEIIKTITDNMQTITQPIINSKSNIPITSFQKRSNNFCSGQKIKGQTFFTQEIAPPTLLPEVLPEGVYTSMRN